MSPINALKLNTYSDYRSINQQCKNNLKIAKVLAIFMKLKFKIFNLNDVEECKI